MMLRHASIRKRLTLLITLVSGVAVLLTTIPITLIGIYNLRDNLLAELQETTTIVGELNQALIAFIDTVPGYKDKAVENLAGAFSSKPSILRACLYNTRGEEQASYFNKSAADKTCPDVRESTEGISRVDGVIRVTNTHLINSLGEVTAEIVLESDMREVHAYIIRQVATALLAALLMSALAYLLALRLQRSITRPLLELAETAREVSARKDYSLRAERDYALEPGNE